MSVEMRQKWVIKWVNDWDLMWVVKKWVVNWVNNEVCEWVKMSANWVNVWENEQKNELKLSSDSE